MEYSDAELVAMVDRVQVRALTPELKLRRVNLRQRVAYMPPEYVAKLNYERTKEYALALRPGRYEYWRERDRKSEARRRTERGLAPAAPGRTRNDVGGHALPLADTGPMRERFLRLWSIEPTRRLAVILDYESGLPGWHKVDHIIARRAPDYWLPADQRGREVHEIRNLRVIPRDLNTAKLHKSDPELIRDPFPFQCTYETCVCGQRAALFPREVVSTITALYEAELAFWKYWKPPENLEPLADVVRAWYAPPVPLLQAA